MVHPTRQIFVLLASLVLFLAVSCAQEPYTLAPETTDYNWRTLYQAGGGYSRLHAVWGRSPEDIWVGGTGTGILHYDGKVWAEVDLSPSPPNEGWIYDIDGDDTGRVFVATSYGMFRLEAGAWERFGDSAHSMWVLASDDVLALQGRSLLHYDGTIWSTLVDSISSHAPTDLWASSAADVYMMQRNRILHYDGTSVSELWRVDSYMTQIWGSDASNVFVTGFGGMLLHYDGSQWTNIAPAIVRAWTLAAVWGSGPEDLFVAQSNGNILHYDGSDWTVQSSPFNVDVTAGFGSDGAGNMVCGGYGVVFLSDGEQWDLIRGVEPAHVDAAWPLDDGGIVVGYSWTAGMTRIAKHDEAGWHEMPTLRNHDVFALWGSQDDLYAATYQNTVVHFDGSEWTGLGAISEAFYIADVWVQSPDRVVACGDGVWWLDGLTWRDAGAPSDDLIAVAADGVGSIMAVGFAGEVVAFIENTWSRTVVDPHVKFHDVWMASPSFAVALATHSDTRVPLIYQFDGSHWSLAPMGRGWTAGRVVGRSRDDVFIAGDNALYHFDGRYWSESPSGPRLSEFVNGSGRLVGWSQGRIVEIDGH